MVHYLAYSISKDDSQVNKKNIEKDYNRNYGTNNKTVLTRTPTQETILTASGSLSAANVEKIGTHSLFGDMHRRQQPRCRARRISSSLDGLVALVDVIVEEFSSNETCTGQLHVNNIGADDVLVG